jgi:hypothetical protein
MSDNIQHIDLDSEDFEDAPRALRDYAKKLKRQLDETAKERDTYKGRAETSVLGDVLKGYVKPERVKSALKSDGIDPLDSEAVQSWFEENGDDFAKAGKATPSTPSAEETAEAAAHERLASTGGLTQPADMSKFDAAKAEITPDMRPEQVREILSRHMG